MKKFLVILSLALFAVPAFAGDYDDLKKEADVIQLNFKNSNTSDLISADGKIRDGAAIQKRYTDAHDFLFKVAKSTLSQSEKAELIIEVCEAYGKAFVELTKPFVDVTPRDIAWDASDSFFNNVGKIVKNYTMLLGEGIGRDFMGIVTGRAFPLLGGDAKRSRVIKGVASDLKDQYKESVAQATTDAGKDEMKTIMQILQDAQASEVTRYGGINRVMVNSYTAIAIWQFFQPFTELPFERTTGSRRVAGLMWFVTIGSFALSRKAGTGFSYYQITRKIEAGIRTALGNVKSNCDATWTGKDRPKQKEIDLGDESAPTVKRKH